MIELRLYLLGTPKIEIDGQEIRLPRRKGLALLAYLVMTGEAQRRDTLATLLWPESDQSKARGALRRELSVLRKTLPGKWWVLDREFVDLNWAAGIWLDVRAYRASLIVDDGKGPDVEMLETGVMLYRDDFLSGFTLNDSPFFDDWQFFEADACRQKMFPALDSLVAVYRQRGEVEKALHHARRRLAMDVLFEPAYRTLMELYALAGQQAAALRQYEDCVRILDKELDVRPQEETAALYEAIRSRRFSEADKLKLPSPPIMLAPPHNLPPQATRFIGREREVEEVLALLAASENRLVAITGAGGMGKTRLGLAVAEAILSDFTDGVWFVPLANVDRAEAVPITIAATLSVPMGGADVRSSLSRFLKEKHLLLLLDNFEHLLEGADFLSELLQCAPAVKLLVTSQERLNLLEESVYPLAGLATSAQDTSANVAHSAAALFEQAARRIKPGFSLEDEKSDVAAICQAVEGMPLAIELAAGWVRLMSCKGIAAEIERDGDFLSTTLRNVPARHRSMRALFERSWMLLSREEQAAMRRLAVFRDGFDRNGALAVADATPQILVSLIDRSLIWRRARDRFDMHGLLRQFATEKLATDSTEEERIQRRHAEFYADLVAQAGWELEPGDATVEAALEGEAANFLAAWRWSVQTQDAPVVRRMMRWLLDYFRRRGDYRGGEAAFASAVRAFRSASEGAEDAALLGSLLLRLGKSTERSHLEARVSRAQEAVTLLRRAQPPDPLELAQALVNLGRIYAALGRNPEGADLMAEAVALFGEVGNQLGVGAALRDWGLLGRAWGQLRQAQRRLEESVLVLEGRDRKSQIQSTFILGHILMMRGHYRRAEALFQRTLPLFIEQGEDVLAGYVLINLGDLYTAMGDFVEAERRFAGAFARFEPFGMAHEVIGSYCLSPATLSRLRGDADAEDRLLDALATARQVGYRQSTATSLHHLARLRHDQQDYEAALALLDEALLISQEIDFRYATALILTQRGHSLLALQKTGAARAAFAQALAIAKREGIDRVSCDALTGVAQQMAGNGDIKQAVTLFTFAQASEASEWETKERARQALPNLEECLSAGAFHAAQEKGRGTDLESLTGSILSYANPLEPAFEDNWNTLQ